MQFNQSPKPSRARVIVLAVVAVLAAALLLRFVLGLGGSRRLSAARLPCTAGQSVTPMGDSILYYDGLTLYCLSSTGAERWSQTLGENAGFSACETAVVAWVNNQLYIIDQNGSPTYNDHLEGTVQFARIGRRYVAAVLGDAMNATLVLKDYDGITVDTETVAYEDMLLLETDFFGNDDEYLWTLSLDVYGTAAETVLNTFEVGKLSTGEVSLGEPLAYEIVYAGGKLHIVNTRSVRVYDYRGTEDTNRSTLVYGWQLVSHDATVTSAASLLFAPVKQTASAVAINELRLLSGTTDKRFTMPDTCVGAVLYNRKIYAFSSDSLYRADVGAQRFSALTLPVGGDVTGYLGLLTNGTALLTVGNTVYAVTLP